MCTLLFPRTIFNPAAAFFAKFTIIYRSQTVVGRLQKNTRQNLRVRCNTEHSYSRAAESLPGLIFKELKHTAGKAIIAGRPFLPDIFDDLHTQLFQISQILCTLLFVERVCLCAGSAYRLRFYHINIKAFQISRRFRQRPTRSDHGGAAHPAGGLLPQLMEKIHHPGMGGFSGFVFAAFIVYFRGSIDAHYHTEIGSAKQLYDLRRRRSAVGCHGKNKFVLVFC